jgi:hypothetical protein
MKAASDSSERTRQPKYDEGFGRRREHANIEAMQNLIIEAIASETEHTMPPLVRNYISALQSAHGGGKTANEPFTRSHLRVASYMQFKGDRATKEQRVRRLINRLEKYQVATGYLLFLVKRGGEPVGTDEKGNTIYSATCYTDFLKPVADAAVQRARPSELWKGNKAKGIRPNPGDALAAQVTWALAQLPRVDEQPGGKETDNMLSLAEYERQSEDQIRAAVEKRADGIAERGGDDALWLERLEVQISRLRRSRAKTGRAQRQEATRRAIDEREAQHRAFDAKMWEGADEPTPYKSEGGDASANPLNCDEKPDMLAAALCYAARGLPILPVNGKVPLTQHGFKDATVDGATIRAWWRKWPDAGIGIPTGVASGWLVLDVDPRHGGHASLVELIEQHGNLPDTLEAKTGGGGYHIIFEYPELAEIGLARGRLPEGLDVRGEGGYIVVAPSLHKSGRRYSWRNDFQPAPAPEWLLKLLTEEKSSPAAPSDSKRRPQPNPRAAIGAVIVEGSRNEALFKIGCSLRGKGAELADIEAELSGVNARRCSPPLPESEVLKIARSAATYPVNSVAVGA